MGLVSRALSDPQIFVFKALSGTAATVIDMCTTCLSVTSNHKKKYNYQKSVTVILSSSVTIALVPNTEVGCRIDVKFATFLFLVNKSH